MLHTEGEEGEGMGLLPFHPHLQPSLLSLTYRQDKTEKNHCDLPGPASAGSFQPWLTLAAV